jgi:hypothetical protein
VSFRNPGSNFIFFLQRVCVINPFAKGIKTTVKRTNVSIVVEPTRVGLNLVHTVTTKTKALWCRQTWVGSSVAGSY